MLCESFLSDLVNECWKRHGYSVSWFFDYLWNVIISSKLTVPTAFKSLCDLLRCGLAGNRTRNCTMRMYRYAIYLQAPFQHPTSICGPEGTRTPNLFHAMEARLPLRYGPIKTLCYNYTWICTLPAGLPQLSRFFSLSFFSLDLAELRCSFEKNQARKEK